jgi:hypothetical protein
VERPALVVVVAVDQLGQDLLERYDSLFTGGSPVSHPGHMTLATGASPRAHEATY